MNTKWMEIVVVTSQEAKDAVADMLYRRGATGVVVEDTELPLGALDNEDFIHGLEPDILLDEVRITAYLPLGVHSAVLLDSLRGELALLSEYKLDPGRAEIILSEVEENDWASAWKEFFKPVRIGNRLVIKPSWEECSLAPHEVVVEIDPGMAFGTGTHPTTVMCLQLLEGQQLAGARLLDLGCGSGILAIAAAKLGAERVVAVDYDPLAVLVAKENTQKNGLGGQIEVVESALLAKVTGEFDVIVANMTAKLILQALPALVSHLTAGGTFIASGIIKERLPLVLAALDEHGLRVLKQQTDGEWVALLVNGGVA